MFIPNTIIQTFRKFANAFFDGRLRKLASDIGIHATANGCTLQVFDAGKSVTCTVACKDSDEPLAESVSISCDLFEQLAQSTGDIELSAVESTEHGSRFKVGWPTGPVVRYTEVDLHTPPDISGVNIPLTRIDDCFLPCLANATEVTDEASTGHSPDGLRRSANNVSENPMGTHHF